VKLVERDIPCPYDYAEIKDDLKRLYEQERFGKSYETYVQELRKKFPVEVRI